MAAFRQPLVLLEAVDRLTEVGLVVSDYRDRITPRAAGRRRGAARDRAAAHPPLVPARSVLPRTRLACDWWGRYEKDEPVTTAYADLAAVTSERITTWTRGSPNPT